MEPIDIKPSQALKAVMNTSGQTYRAHQALLRAQNEGAEPEEIGRLREQYTTYLNQFAVVMHSFGDLENLLQGLRECPKVTNTTYRE